MEKFEIKDYGKLREDLVKWIRDWFEENGPGCNAIIGLSGGKDSTITAALCVEALGKDRVIGVAMPDYGGFNEADKIADYLGIRFLTAPISSIFNGFKSMWYYFEDENFNWSDQTIQNIPPRIRMTMLYAIAQTFNGRVSCNCNLSEDWIGYSTIFGDQAGSFAPLSLLTVTEIRKLGHEMGLPDKWVEKVPDDGLPNSCPDEEKFGFSYTVLDKYIRTGICEDIEIKNKIDRMHEKNLFKVKMLRIPVFDPEIPILAKDVGGPYSTNNSD